MISNLKISKLIILNLFLTINFFVRSQYFEFGIIYDIDGYVNVRSKKEIKSNIIDTLNNGRIVSHFGKEGNWINVEYEKNDSTKNGYVYFDRVINLSSYNELHPVKISNNKIQFKNDSLKITLSQNQFDKVTNQLIYEGNYISQINGLQYFGTDGFLPTFQYDKIEIELNKNPVNFPFKEYRNLFNPNINDTHLYIDSKNSIFYIYAMNSDAAGAYAVVWSFENNQYKFKKISIPF